METATKVCLKLSGPHHDPAYSQSRPYFTVLQMEKGATKAVLGMLYLPKEQACEVLQAMGEILNK